MTNKELLEEAELLSKLVIDNKPDEALARFTKFSTDERLSILFLLWTVHSLAFKQIENHPLLKF